MALIKQREKYKIILPAGQAERIKNNQCPVCGSPRTEWKGNRAAAWKTCSPECSRLYQHELKMFTWEELRQQAFARDNYTCQHCHKQPVVTMNHNGQELSLTFDNPNYSYYAKRFLVGDHILPIALGGDEWDLKNVQTLCLTCNKIKTKEDQRRILERKREM